MPLIKNEDLAEISQSVTSLIKGADKRRLDFMKLLLTIYTPVTSGLFFVAVNYEFSSAAERNLFLGVATTAGIIVGAALSIFYFYFLTSVTVAQKYVDEVNKTGKHYNSQILGKEWQSKAIKMLTTITAITVILNLFLTISFIYTAV